MVSQYDVYDIANWFYNNNLKVQESTYDGNLTLNKLLYFADSFNYVLNGKKLIEQEVVGYVNGPVYQDIYIDFRHNEMKLIKERNKNLDNDTVELLKIVNFMFGQSDNYKKLSEITHNQSPWKNKKEDCQKVNYNPELDFSDFSEEERTNMIELYNTYKYLNLDNLFVDKIGNNTVIYTRDTELTDEDYLELEALEEEEDSLFVKKIDGELVYG
ncbi:Panacea domain-containing protein [Staphylococcus pettenkoferi]|uniref:DUF4065 domain-containing protein n=1 Tax=Staphylococcus pettenkoferi TaxID=170573 RepID=A0ABT4BJT5_9STAP|nr:type II toxin-antitoxin system antitoxin SocA domain-containing protein [Staphylococcus pettenkoferi]MCY1565590.1 DUF4065 domain-containing protein [Staphylococcus pettenkoferi]MCY1570949.1 DUF4065 domain-containing protein [Staphylococcus pettenkoferi]MCY1582938.1 DUF4065 domain-containing protein [Staphylococcus pettenkoferi]MCY1607099.1 DUF4065 domain-containing protein [Staphylococcus pettenkoferi]MDH9616244.1 DUF4065 domain-containing protein [Staphylococcus pettenkoferi]